MPSWLTGVESHKALLGLSLLLYAQVPRTGATYVITSACRQSEQSGPRSHGVRFSVVVHVWPSSVKGKEN